ncbi:o-succinylbenzoate--CoA ligase [Effusibacillus consociatus]|uniref:O-succinylbenzoate--CoA ligase n=1 Tax=Effusibacillus consociatus TaxID=1117041 RepID=A0ABV9PYG9_9BACL
MQGIAYWIEKRASMTPNRIALVGESRRLTYQEAAESIDRIAQALAQGYQVQSGDRIAILSANSIEYIQLLFAIAKLGCIGVPLNTRLTPKELAFQLNDSQSAVLLTGEEFYEIGTQMQESSSVKHVTRIDALEESAFDSGAADMKAVPDWNTTAPLGSTPFLICYTSGTTGRPKGALLTQENMFWNGVNNILTLDITSDDRVLTLLPLFHIGGIGLFAFPALLAGGTVVIPNRFDPEKALALIEQEMVTIVMGVPTIHDALRKSDRFPQTDLSSLRWFYSGGAPCPHELIRFYLDKGIPFGQGYGMTETSPTVFLLSKEDYGKKIGSIGKPAMFCDIRIVDNEGKDVALGEIGELLVKGPNVFKEYWNLPDETAKSFQAEWFRTGDLVRMDEEGFVYIAGRKKDMIISGGENIYPLEVEQVIGQHPAVAEAAVVGIGDEKWGEVPIAIVALKEEHHLTEKELLDYCTAVLAKYKCPKSVKFVAALPKNATGKIDKASLKREYA